MRSGYYAAGQLPDYILGAIASRESAKVLCPSCKGGDSAELSLYVVRKGDGMFGKCYRAKCSFFFNTIEANLDAVKEHRPDFTLETRSLSPAAVDYLAASYALYEENVADWRETGDRWGTIVLPVRGPFGDHRGVQTRTLFKRPKVCRTYRETGGVFQHWDTPAAISECTATVVVEDQLSARRLRELGYRAVALLGTNMDKSQAKEIAEHTWGKLVIALDDDAFNKAVRMRAKHSDVLPKDTRVLCLPEDIKNMPDDSYVQQLISDAVKEG